ncbi:RHS repeat protein, partial [Bradyrhizobium jicamae]
MTTATSSVTAIDVADFVQSIGVNTHLGNWTVYNNVGLVESALAYLGVTNVRDGSMFSTTVAQSEYSQLAAHGIKFDFFTAPGTNIATFTQQLDAFVAAHPNSLLAIEGPNEVDIESFSYNGSSSLASAGAFQHALFAALQADPKLKDVPVYDLTLSQSNSANYSQVGNLSSVADYANIHAYVWSGTTPNQVLLNDMKIAQWDAPGRPVVFTETGYDTMTSDSMSGVDQTVQAKYTLDTLMDAFKDGVSQTFLYELFDEASDPNFTNAQAHFGLFNNDGSPKLVATAIHNLTTILSDPNASQPFTPGSLSYSLGNMPSGASQMLLEKHNGTFDLVLWNEQDIWNSTTHKEIAASTSTVTVNLGKSYAVIYVYDPLVGTSPIATYTNVSQIKVSLTDHPLIIQIGSVVSTSATTTVDTTPPATPSITSFSPDTSVVGDGITNVNRLTLTGTAEAGSKVLVFDGATQIGTATVGTNGTWSFATGTLADGTHAFTSEAVDAAGNVSTVSSALKVTVDTVAPNAPVLLSDTLTTSNRVVVSGTAEAGSTIKLYEGSTLLGTTVVASNGT